MKKLNFFGKTDMGMVRNNNEDNFILKKYGKVLVAGVADGMGGHFAGEVASEIAVKTIEKFFYEKLSKFKIFEIIEDSFFYANKKIYEEAQKKGPKVMMGTTLTLSVLEEKGSGIYDVYFGHIGDSKLYHLDSNDIVQKSVDHTMLQRMIDAGALTKEEIENYAHKNIIYKSLGSKEHLDMDEVKKFELGKNQALLLCSDGLSGYLKPEEMLSIVKGTKNVKEAVNYMINLAKYRGGDDNITVILIENGRIKRGLNPSLKKIKVKNRKSSKGNNLILYILLSFLVILLVALGYFGYKEIKKVDKNIEMTEKRLNETQTKNEDRDKKTNSSLKSNRIEQDMGAKKGEIEENEIEKHNKKILEKDKTVKNDEKLVEKNEEQNLNKK